jgi:outer membrane protein assembly factor BamD
MGARFRQKAGDAYTKIVRDYPLSQYANLAKKKLGEMEMAVPEADPAAVARMKYEAANHVEPGMVHKMTDFMRRNPDMSDAAKTGAPTMDPPKREIPANIPLPADATAAGFNGDVTVAPVTGTSALDTQPDARPAPPAAGTTPAPAAGSKPGGQDTKKSQ